VCAEGCAGTEGGGGEAAEWRQSPGPRNVHRFLPDSLRDKREARRILTGGVMAKQLQEEAALTVKGIRAGVIRRFGAACRLEGRTMKEVLEEFMREYAAKALRALKDDE
jgi:hypothetical protein